jgi:DNA-binding beta-propeller fold protein YncE
MTLRACTLFLNFSLLSAQPLRLEKTIPLNVEGRIDHMSADVRGNRLFMAALGNNTVEVIDLAAGAAIRSLKGFHEPQGVYYWAAGDSLYIANGQTGKLNVLDGHSFQKLKTYDFNSDADNVRFDVMSKEVYVGYGGGALGVVNADLGVRVGETMLDAHPESFQLEISGPRIFVNVPNAANVTVVDRRTRTVAAKWPVTTAKSNFPMALDEANHRLFIGCRKPAKLIVLDTVSGKEVASVDIVGDTDDLFYDATRKRIYISGGAGAITVLQQKDADHYEEISRIPTAPRARTSLFIPELKRFCVAVPHQGKQRSELLVFASE